MKKTKSSVKVEKLNLKWRIFFIITGLLGGIFLIKIIYGYYPSITSSITNTLTRVFFWLFIGVGASCIVGLIFFQKWIYAKRKELLLFFSVFLLGIIFIEIFLRVLDHRQIRFSPHPYLNYMGTPNYKSADGLNMHNSLGFRGPEIQIPKPKNRIRIAILGGSTTYEDFVKDWKKDFARKLEYELKKSLPDKDIEVINAGLPGWDSWEDLVNLEFKLLDLDLNYIIVYEGTNDVHARFVRPDAYKADNTGSKKQWERKLCLDIWCLKIVQTITGFDVSSFDIVAPTSAQFTASSEYNQILGMKPIEALSKNPPIYSERNLRNIIAVARENEIGIMLATWAWSDEMKDYAATVHYQKGFIDQNNMVKKVGKLKSVPVYDFAKEMPMDEKYWGDGRHNNEKGVNLKAKLFRDFIIKNNILEKKEQNIQ